MEDNFNNNIDSNDLNNDIDVNQKNESLYNNLIEDSKVKTDGYWDRNNPIIKILLTVLLIFGLVGFIYYFVIALNMK